MNAATLPVTCLRCGHELDMVNSTPATPTRLVAILGCVNCRAEHELHVALNIHALPRPIAAPVKCGTRRGYDQHRRNGQQPCDDCTAAQRIYVSEYRTRKRQGA